MRLDGLGVVGLEEEAPSGGSLVPGAGAGTLGEGGGCAGAEVFGVLHASSDGLVRALRGAGRTSTVGGVGRLVRDDAGAPSGARGACAGDAHG